MKQVSITCVPEGTKFTYKEKEWEVTDRSQYPLIEAKCLTEPNDYEGLNVLFCNFEKVEVADDEKIYEQYFEETRKHYFQMKERLV